MHLGPENAKEVDPWACSEHAWCSKQLPRIRSEKKIVKGYEPYCDGIISSPVFRKSYEFLDVEASSRVTSLTSFSIWVRDSMMEIVRDFIFILFILFILRHIPGPVIVLSRPLIAP